MEYDILKKGICSFNAQDYHKSECRCDTGFPILRRDAEEVQGERAYLQAIDAQQKGFFSYESGDKNLQKGIERMIEYLRKYRAVRGDLTSNELMKRLNGLIPNLQDQLADFENLQLVEADLPSKIDNVKKIYTCINSELLTKKGMQHPTLVGKILHILQPQMFVIWDSITREARDFNQRPYSERYWEYLTLVEEGLHELLDDFRLTHDPSSGSSKIEASLYEDGCKPLTKLHDEACYAMAKGWLHFY